ncbi:MAG: hypothetical protein AB8B50_06885 [Pirellulaceae bacterium]
MPIQIQCTSVVIRNDSLDRELKGGTDGFGAITPNALNYGHPRQIKI